jgi:hypothetical protein
MTTKTVDNADFKDSARTKPTFFTRTGGDRKPKMTVEDLMFFLLFHMKRSIPSALRRFFKDKGVDITMAQQSLSEAREKVNPEAFKRLFVEAAQLHTEHKTETWNRYCVLAIDGTKIALPNYKKVLDFYGGTGKNADSPTAQASALYDVLNDTLLDVAMEPLKIDERTLAYGHISALKTFPIEAKKLLTYDRGYPSFDLIKRHEDEGLYYLMRVRSKFNAAIDAQTKSDGYMWLEKDGERIHVRVIKFLLDSGEEEVLITNITDKRLGKNAFKKLYFRRWPLETKYGVVKEKLQIENFSSKLPNSLKQEFYAAMYMANLVSAAAFDVKNEVNEERNNKGNKHKYKVNLNEVIGILKDNLIEAVYETCPTKQSMIFQGILRDVKRFVAPIRPNRSVPRNPSPRKSKFHHNKKVNC